MGFTHHSYSKARSDGSCQWVLKELYSLTKVKQVLSILAVVRVTWEAIKTPIAQIGLQTPYREMCSSVV